MKFSAVKKKTKHQKRAIFFFFFIIEAYRFLWRLAGSCLSIPVQTNFQNPIHPHNYWGIIVSSHLLHLWHCQAIPTTCSCDLKIETEIKKKNQIFSNHNVIKIWKSPRKKIAIRPECPRLMVGNLKASFSREISPRVIPPESQPPPCPPPKSQPWEAPHKPTPAKILKKKKNKFSDFLRNYQKKIDRPKNQSINNSRFCDFSR